MIPKLSVIVPVYNSEKYLKCCLESIMNQTLKELEIICINDGSTDGSSLILNELQKVDARIKIINIKNHGPAYARNLGIDIAKGDFITFIDSDDFIENLEYYDILYNEALLQNADVVKTIYKDFPSGFINQIHNDKIKENKFNFCAMFSSAIYHKDLLKKYKLKFPNLRNMEDPVFALRVAITANKIIVIDELYITIRKHPLSATSKPLLFNILIDKLIGLNMIINLANKNINDKSSYLFVITYWYAITFREARSCQSFVLNCIINIAEFLMYLKIKNKKDFKDLLRKEYFDDFLNFENNLFFIILKFIFSSEIKNSHKVFTILGIKFKFRMKIG